MPPTRVSQRATTHALAPERVIHKMVVKLTRVRRFEGSGTGATVMFTFEGGTRRADRSRCSFINKDNVPDFEGEEAWFEVEQVSAKPWPFWRAVRQVDEPGDARA